MNPQSPNLPEAMPARLGALEAQVMNLLWSGASFTVRAIIEQLPSDPAYTTIATVLSNLRKKQLVCTKKEGYATLYAACVSREERAAQIMEQALNESGDRAASMLQFLEGMPEDDLHLLRQYLLEESG
ncbi:MAG: BlaI/MecI/CopY family transcriptional regulator [Canibacter sp.]